MSYRILRLGDEGADVKARQGAVNDRLHARHADAMRVDVDGVLGSATASSASFVLYALGVTGKRFRQSKVSNGGVIDRRAQQVIEHPTTRTPGMLARAVARRSWVKAHATTARLGSLTDHVWLPAGAMPSLGLQIEHQQAPEDGGAFLAGCLPKVVLHTTEGLGVDTMARVLLGKRAEPHFLIGRDGDGPMRVIQFIGMDRAARALEHPGGTPATNGAFCIQIEIAGFARDSHDWDDTLYGGLAALACLIEQCVPVPRKVPRTFSSDGTATRPPRRFSPGEFLRATGYVGHEHVPSQPANHWDPGRLDATRRLFPLMKHLNP